jgi:hypothetical protein
MRIALRCSGAIGALAAVALASAQEPLRAPTLEERIVTLERDLAAIETRVGLESTRAPTFGGETGTALAGRVDAVERSVERLVADIQRIERLADSAARAAAEAQRDATAAQQAARDAAMRAR